MPAFSLCDVRRDRKDERGGDGHREVEKWEDREDEGKNGQEMEDTVLLNYKNRRMVKN